MSIAVAALAQDRTITGTVTGKDDGQPIPGVSVKLRGAQGGAQTGADGKYAIKLPAGATGIEFSSIGYISQYVPLKAGNLISVSLAGDSKSLGEVVVTANSIKREKRTLGYSAPTIKNSELTEGGSPSAITSLT
ncbi:carboxypeptidase-like regulatory domain-containing protein [Pedobacter sp. NJ-S-72]